MPELTISEVAKRAGINASAIRYYERVKLLPEPQRSHGHRRYDAAIVRRISFIRVAQAAGFSVAEMQTILNEIEGEQPERPLSLRWQALSRQKLGEVIALIEQAHEMKKMLENGLRCGCPDLDQCIDCVLANC